MGLDDALIFTRVVELHSFTQAAQSLGMQKSTVSRRIALLEERLGVRLINRTTRKLRLTEVGQAYYDRCRQIMHDFAEAEQAVMQLQQAPSGLLRISAPIEFGQMYLAKVVGDFMNLYPQITAEVELTSRTVDPLEEGVDIVIMVGQPEDSTLIARRMLTTNRCLCASPDYLALHGRPDTVEELAGHHALGRRTLERRFRQATGNSIVEYVQRVRVEAAKQRLESSRKSVAEVMYEVGYNDTKAFRDIFNKYCGMSPVGYRERYQ